MKKKEFLKLKRERNFFMISLIVMFTLFATLSYLTSNLQQEIKEETPLSFEENFETTSTKLQVPAIDKEGKGVTAFLIVEAKKGTGKTLVDIDNLLFFTDTQTSIKTAKEVAQKHTGLNLDNYDLTYNINAQATNIGGPSAGAALTIATIAALNQKEIKEDVIITGRILLDGTIGSVSGIENKGIAAKNSGATMFLVPKDQNKEAIYQTKRTCTDENGNEICTIKRLKEETTIGEKIGLNIIEVKTITEAYNYFVS